MADHSHGNMNVKIHEKTFEGFIRFVTWGFIIAFLVLIFLALANS